MVTNNTNQLDFVERWSKEMASSHKTMGDNEVSVTELNREPCQFWLMRRHKDEIAEDLQDLSDTNAGTCVHESLEEFARKLGYETEEELSEVVTVNGKDWTIYGKYDCYREPVLVDIKNTKQATFNKNSTGKEDEWYKQTMTYARMIENKGKLVNHITIQARISDLSVVKELKANQSADKFRRIDFDLNPVSCKKAEFERIKQEQIQRIKEYMFTEDVKDEKLPKCSDEYTWSGVSWKVIKEGNKTAKKVCSSEEEAELYIKNNNLSGHQIVRVVTEPIRCLYFCPCKEFCPHYKNLVNPQEKKCGNIFIQLEEAIKDKFFK